jgi:hypothetical protein
LEDLSLKRKVTLNICNATKCCGADFFGLRAAHCWPPMIYEEHFLNDTEIANYKKYIFWKKQKDFFLEKTKRFFFASETKNSFIFQPETDVINNLQL